MAHRTANTPSNSSVLSSCLFLSVMETCIKIPYSNYSIPIRPFWILRFDSKRDFTSWTLSVAKKAVAKLMQMVQRSSYDAAKLKYEGCSRAAKLRKMHCSSVGCSCAQLKNIHPLRTDFWPEGKHFIFGNQCCGSGMIYFGSDPGSGSGFSESSGSDPGSGSGSYSGSGSCMNTYTHTQISTHIHTYIHTDTQTYTNTNTHTYTVIHTHIHTTVYM